MELASRGSKPRSKHGYNLPVDPRPTLSAIAQGLADAMAKSGVSTTVVQNPAPYGFGGAFRKDRWFATVPDYQSPGTSALAPQPGLMLPKPERKLRPQPATNPDESIKPTRTWPQISLWLAQSICDGRENCRHEANGVPVGPAVTSSCDPLWQKHSNDLFEAFLNANPSTMFRDQYLGCVAEIEPYHRCRKQGHRPMSGGPIDHAQLCRLPDGSRFIISQPYCCDELCKQCLADIATWQDEIPNLRWVSAGRERSWYFPNNANLIVLGTQETLNSLNLDYAVPVESSPTSCARYPTRL